MAAHSDLEQRPRVLLTGGSGFTGYYVAEHLQTMGYQVGGLSDSTTRTDVDSVHVNLNDKLAVRDAVARIQPRAVVHLAAISFVAHADVNEIYQVNIVGTRNLLEALAELPRLPQVVVLASSANIYGNATVEPITEDVPPAPANDYAVSKLAMEYMARLWADKLPIVVARPFNYTGVGQTERFLIPKIVAHFRRQAAVIKLGNTEVWRDFSDVRDVACSYGHLVELRPAGRVFNICSGVGHSLDEVLDIMAELAGYRIKVEVNPAFVREHEVRRLVGSNTRLQALSGVRPRISFKDTLQWMYHSTAEHETRSPTEFLGRV